MTSWRAGPGAACLLLSAVLVAGACSGDDSTGAPSTAQEGTRVDVGATTAPTDLPPSEAAPIFTASIEAVTAEQLHASWRPGCPHPVEALRLVRASHWGFDGAAQDGSIVVDAAVADAIVQVLRDLFDARYPIERMEPIDRYGGSDDASMAANNTSGFNCRRATGGTGWSEHAFGRAVDLNPLQNPYVRGDVVLPPQSAAYVDRTRTDLGMVHAGDAAVTAFARQGWSWGGEWSTLKDYQHFSASGR